ncbi:MAG: HAD family hydrolase [Butyrivibrio sp.]|uniref:HAD family hydrolase n=1 Tax=Butyrivibrio sp. TaxID=28121 RepID=UPI0025C1E578|nr:HAD family hydrolase [Butyrivibrio sp.]MBQ6587416.1 HAD family hydrolase [Butyrivibrio sp.]
MKKEFDNYIFDLYGTLIDIHTDEEQPELWEKMALYLEKEYGSKYTSKSLRKRYLEICKDEENKLQKKNGARWPEIRIEDVWVRLILEGPEDESDIVTCDPIAFANSPEIRQLCVYFREVSRDKLVVYEGVIETMDKLKKSGKGIFLLSNAQRAFTEKELEVAGLTDYFDDIFISSDKGIKKPQREFLEKLIKDNSLISEKCVMIGNDLCSDVGVAFANGINSVFLNTYDYSDKKIDEELTELGIKGSKFMPLIVEDGDIRRILPD